jgi:hypothetical protein
VASPPSPKRCHIQHVKRVIDMPCQSTVHGFACCCALLLAGQPRRTFESLVQDSSLTLFRNTCTVVPRGTHTCLRQPLLLPPAAA